MTTEQIIQELKILVQQWREEQNSMALSEWVKGYNVSCGSRADEVEELLDKLNKNQLPNC